MICVPMISKENLVGVIQVINKKMKAYLMKEILIFSE